MSWLSKMFSSKDEYVQVKIFDINFQDESIPISKISRIYFPTLQYKRTSYMDSSSYDSDYNLTEIGIIEDAESIVRQAHRRKTSLMFKEGYDFVSKNQQSLSYVQERLDQIAQATNIPTQEFLKKIGISLVRLSNAFVVKVRSAKLSSGQIRTSPEKKKVLPVAGYFILPAENMKYIIDMQYEVYK